MLTNIEFNGLPEGEVEVRIEGEKTFTLIPENRNFICEFIEILESKRPQAYIALKKRYIKSKENKLYYEFLICRGFIKCNFIMLDNKLDIDASGNFNTEFVLCPLAGECCEFGIVCNSQESTELSNREVEILRLISQGLENVEIGELLYISPHTVHNHRNNILRKLNLTNTASLVRYYFEKGLDK